MFSIYDGRECFYQWDSNRKVIVSDSTISEVHFCNKTDDCSLVVEVKDGIADVPNILLQNDYPIKVYAYCSDGYTKVEKTFKVNARTKPSDYIYTETEVKTLEAIEQRINDLEASFGDNIDEAVREYIEENPIEVDLSNTAEKDHKHTVADITDYAEPDLSEYAKKNDIPSLNGYATEKYVDDAVANLDIPEVDLDGYATENWVKNQGYINSIPEEYVTDTELTAKGYASKDDLSIYAKKSDIPDVSDFITSIPAEYITEDELNAKGYLTKHQSLDGYATEDYVDDAIANAKIDIEQIDLSEYAKKEDIPDVSDFISEIPEEYVTEEELSKKGYLTQHQDISGKADKEHKHSISDITDYIAPDLSNYYTKSEVDNKIPDISEFISAIPDEYITETELNNKGYLTEHQSLAGYATTTYVDDAIANIPEGGGGTYDNVEVLYRHNINYWDSSFATIIDTTSTPYTGEILTSYIEANGPVPCNGVTYNSEIEAFLYYNSMVINDGVLSIYGVYNDGTNIYGLTRRIYTDYLVDTVVEIGNAAVTDGVSADTVQSMIDKSLGVIENGSY